MQRNGGQYAAGTAEKPEAGRAASSCQFGWEPASPSSNEEGGAGDQNGGGGGGEKLYRLYSDNKIEIASCLSFSVYMCVIHPDAFWGKDGCEIKEKARDKENDYDLGGRLTE